MLYLMQSRERNEEGKGLTSQLHAPVTYSGLGKERDCSQSNFIVGFFYFINLI